MLQPDRLVDDGHRDDSRNRMQSPAMTYPAVRNPVVTELTAVHPLWWKLTQGRSPVFAEHLDGTALPYRPADRSRPDAGSGLYSPRNPKCLRNFSLTISAALSLMIQQFLNNTHIHTRCLHSSFRCSSSGHRRSWRRRSGMR